MARSDFAPFILGKESSRYDRQSKDHPSFFPVDLSSPRLQEFLYFSCSSLLSRNVCLFYGLLPPFEVYRFKFFQRLFLFSICISAFFSSSRNNIKDILSHNIFRVLFFTSLFFIILVIRYFCKLIWYLCLAFLFISIM